MKTLEILKQGALTIQVCTNYKTKKTIEQKTRQLMSDGLSWCLDEKESKRLGQEKVLCSEHKDRSHYILYC